MIIWSRTRVVMLQYVNVRTNAAYSMSVPYDIEALFLFEKKTMR